jgi:hypothetical protein
MITFLFLSSSCVSSDWTITAAFELAIWSTQSAQLVSRGQLIGCTATIVKAKKPQKILLNLLVDKHGVNKEYVVSPSKLTCGNDTLALVKDSAPALLKEDSHGGIKG